MHRLVLLTFVPEHDGLPIANHIDEDKTNNRLDNLQWCDSQYNNTYNGRHIRAGLTQRINNDKLRANN